MQEEAPKNIGNIVRAEREQYLVWKLDRHRNTCHGAACAGSAAQEGSLGIVCRFVADVDIDQLSAVAGDAAAEIRPGTLAMACCDVNGCRDFGGGKHCEVERNGARTCAASGDACGWLCCRRRGV